MLTDAAVPVLARQAVDLLDADVAVRIEPQAGSWLVWPLVDGPSASFGIYVGAAMAPVEAVAHLIDGLGEDVSGTARFWGVPFPPCPGHEHPASVAAAEGAVQFGCPVSGAVVERIMPAA